MTDMDPPLVKATLVSDEPTPIIVRASQGSSMEAATVVTPLMDQPAIEDTGGLLGLGRYSTRITCPFCHENVMTRTESHVTKWTIAASIFMIMAFWPLFWLPFCMPVCKATDHYCTRCNRKVGRGSECTA
uniref:LITAF domain-containing protein n=1 Tax=Cyclophora tenuis TaxID=216820 RepID=A0A7S1DE21_CYCTE|mmetsp:Transcript_8881/g.14938  ORF Transcript_8881/g.14938 Transcript_8881/m.14938 type:complete len:130 (+) Transcript_8881:68-457(+)